jgi:hypothetical protein
MPTAAYVRYIKSDCTALVRVELTHASSDVPIEDAVVRCTLIDELEQEVGGQAWPVDIPHVAQGVHEGYLSEQLNGAIGEPYQALISVVSPTAGKAELVIPVTFEANAG